MPVPIVSDVSPAQRGGRPTAVQRIYDHIRQRIIDLTLPPGAVISQKEIAETFGVSQTPVREALILLEEEGLVDIVPQSRTAVSVIDIQNAREAHFLRRSVEVEIARILSADISEDEVAGLREIIARQEADLSIGDLSAFIQSDNRFHARMYEIAGVGGLWGLIKTRRAHLDRLRRLHLPTKGKARAILKDHRAILDAIAARDMAAAEAAVREHLKGTVSATGKMRSLFPEYFG